MIKCSSEEAMHVISIHSSLARISHMIFLNHHKEGRQGLPPVSGKDREPGVFGKHQ